MGWLLMGITLVFCALTVAWIAHYRKGKIVRASQPGFLFMLVFGVAVYVCAVFPFTVDSEVRGGREERNRRSAVNPTAVAVAVARRL